MATGTRKRLLHWAMVLEYWHLVSAYQFTKLHLCLKVNFKNLILHVSFAVLHPRAVTLLQGKKLASPRSRFTWSERERGVAGPATHASKGPFWVFKCVSFFTAVRWGGGRNKRERLAGCARGSYYALINLGLGKKSLWSAFKGLYQISQEPRHISHSHEVSGPRNMAGRCHGVRGQRATLESLSHLCCNY